MPWVRVLLRGQKVYARVKADGAFDAAEAGRIEVRYQANDGRAYHAAVRNLERLPGESVLPEETCAPARASETPPKDKVTATRRAPIDRAGPVPAGAWTVYADGACSGNPGPAGLGIVLVSPEGVTAEGFEYLGVGTNNIAELTGILRAAELLPKDAVAVVHTDSQYAIGVLTKGWKAKANQELIATIKSALSTRKKWHIVYVPGHAGVPLNERADSLAREAVRTKTTRLPKNLGVAEVSNPEVAL